MGELTFLDYDKISDTLMYFSKEISLNFCVGLTRKNQQGQFVSYHNEYGYKNNGKQCYSIKRNIYSYFIINDYRDFNNSILIRPQDVSLLQMILNSSIIPWVVGPKRIYSFDSNQKLIIKGKWSQVDFPLSEYKYLSFAPIIIAYQDQTMKEGIRITINNKSNYIDIDINKFMEFYYYICNTDMYSAAIGLLNYVKSGPYGMNLHNIDSDNNNDYRNDSFGDWDDAKRSNKGKKNSFFDSL